MSRHMHRLIAALIGILLLTSFAEAQSRPQKYISTASTNATLVKGGNVLLYTVVAVNTSATVYYLKLYDKSSAPTCNSDAVQALIAIPFGASNAGGGAVVPISVGVAFDQGLGFCITAGSADNDNTNAATGVTVSFFIK